MSKYFAVTAVVNNPHEYTNVHIYNYVQTLPNSLRHSASCSVGKAPGDAPLFMPLIPVDLGYHVISMTNYCYCLYTCITEVY